ncbi:MAG: hypothetical protein AB1568_10910 [Thermodesulfobacteriota bacterium]
MANISLRGIDENVKKMLKKQAAQNGVSINALILDYIHKGIGIDPTRRPRHHDLDRLAGTWTEKDQEEFADAVTMFETIDDDIWK